MLSVLKTQMHDMEQREAVEKKLNKSRAAAVTAAFCKHGAFNIKTRVAADGNVWRSPSFVTSRAPPPRLQTV